MDSDVPTQAIAKKSRLGDLHRALVMDKEAAKGHAQWWRPEMKGKMDTQTWMDPGASFVLDGGGPVLPAWVSEACARISGRKLTEEGERNFADLV